jgi:hypothetical protein
LGTGPAIDRREPLISKNIPERRGGCAESGGDLIWLANRNQWRCADRECGASYEGWDGWPKTVRPRWLSER